MLMKARSAQRDKGNKKTTTAHVLPGGADALILDVSTSLVDVNHGTLDCLFNAVNRQMLPAAWGEPATAGKRKCHLGAQGHRVKDHKIIQKTVLRQDPTVQLAK